MDGAYVEIRAGLAAGDTVVTSAQFLLDSESSKAAELERMTDDDTAAPQRDDEHGHHGHH